MLERTPLFRRLDGRINHVEAHDGLPVRKRRFDVVDGRRTLEDPLRFPGRAEIRPDDLGVGILLLEALLRFGRVADQAEAPPFLGQVGDDGGGLFPAGAGYDDEVGFFVHRGGGLVW